MWALMETCWEHDPDRRPTAAQIINSLPPGSSDVRLSHDWGSLSSSSFRTHHKYHAHGSGQESPVFEALNALESTIVCIGGSHGRRSPGPIYRPGETSFTTRASLSHPTSPEKSGHPANSRPVVDSPSRKLSHGAGRSYSRSPSCSSLVSPRRGQRHETETDTDTDFSVDLRNDKQTTSKFPFRETTPLASTPDKSYEMRPSPKRAESRLDDIAARITSVLGDSRQYRLFLGCQRSEAQMHALLDLLQEVSCD